MTNTDLKFDERWQHVVKRDRKADGLFVFAVRTTGIYCRPSCPSRRAHRENISFYDIAEAAEYAGYRACLRCKPADPDRLDDNHRLVRNVCHLIAASEDVMPRLSDLAARTGISAHHLQRRFKALMGVSPKVYGDTCRRRRVRGLLKNGDGVAGALYEAGYGSSSRLYENADSWLGMTPASYARGGKGAMLNYIIVDCPLGRMIVAATSRGIAFLGFGDRDDVLVAELHGDFPNAEISPDDGIMEAWVKLILDDFDHHVPRPDLPLDVRGTAFQARVWQALQQIPPGETRTYRELAESLGKPKAARAVGQACATNPVSLIVPCHRAVGSGGSLTGYRWGVPRKRKLLANENDSREEE